MLSYGFWFLVCYAVAQLAFQLHQECIQVVCSNRMAWKRLTDRECKFELLFVCLFCIRGRSRRFQRGNFICTSRSLLVRHPQTKCRGYLGLCLWRGLVQQCWYKCRPGFTSAEPRRLQRNLPLFFDLFLAASARALGRAARSSCILHDVV